MVAGANKMSIETQDSKLDTRHIPAIDSNKIEDSIDEFEVFLQIDGDGSSSPGAESVQLARAGERKPQCDRVSAETERTQRGKENS